MIQTQNKTDSTVSSYDPRPICPRCGRSDGRWDEPGFVCRNCGNLYHRHFSAWVWTSEVNARLKAGNGERR